MSRTGFELFVTSAGERTAVIQGPVSEQTRIVLASEGFSRLMLDHGSGPGLEFLWGRPIINLLVRSREVDWDLVSSFSSLRALTLDGAYEPRIDFSRLPDLQYLELYWEEKLAGILAKAEPIVALRLHKGTDESWHCIRRLKNLRALSIVQMRGIESLSNFLGAEVQYAEFVKCSQVEGIGDLSGAANLRCLNVSQCSGTFLTDDLCTSPLLEELLLSIERTRTLKPLADTKIRRLRFECAVDDGDIGFLLDMPHLEFCLFKNARNLSVRSDKVQKALAAKGFDQQSIRDQLSRFPFASDFV